MDAGVTEDYVKFVARTSRGEFLAEARYEDWSAAPRHRVHEQVREILLPAAVDVSRPAATRTRLAEALVALDLFDESAHFALARALADAGRRAAALTLLNGFAQRLQVEFDEEPSVELEEAQRSLRDESSSTGSIRRERTKAS